MTLKNRKKSRRNLKQDLNDPTVNNVNEIKKSTSKKRRVVGSRRFVFSLGAILGVILAIYFGSSDYNIPDLDELVNFNSVSSMFEDWKYQLPLSLQGILQTAESHEELRGSTESFAVGKEMRSNGYKSKHPVVLVPGVISTGIVSWGLEGTEECPSEPHFRKRLWGSFYMLRTMFLDKNCWLQHIMMDKETGLDPPGIKLRAAQGFDAADFFITGYWIWNKILQNLAVIGYNPNNMLAASYDWRLNYLDLERRDGYFSKLKMDIEMTKKMTGEKPILVGHSMGSQIIYFFMKWAEADGFGGGGASWVNDNIAAIVDISGSMLGTPKAIPALLSGEMKDTVQLNALAVQGLEKFFSRRERLDMLQTFGGVASMIPKGGELIWGDMDGAPDDHISNATISQENETFGRFIRFTNPIGSFSSENLTLSNSIDYLLSLAPDWFRERTLLHYSFGYTKNRKQLEANNADFSKWTNPLEAPLPNAPDLEIYCFYGIGNPTERAYHYQEEKNKNIFGLNVSIDIDRSDAVMLGEGDGTVSLLTHAMCHKWKEPGNIYNTGSSKVTIVEMQHEPDRFDMRGGAKTAEHVDILGSTELNEMVLKVAAGRGHEIEDRILSPLDEIVRKMDF